MERSVPPRPSRRAVLGTGAGAGLGALTLTALGSLPGLSGVAQAASAEAGEIRPTDPGSYISFTPKTGAFPLVRDGQAVPIVVSADDHTGVVRVAGDLRDDIERVTGVRPRLVKGDVPRGSREITLRRTPTGSPGICRRPTRTPGSSSSATRSRPPRTSTPCARRSSPTCTTRGRDAPPPTTWRPPPRPGSPRTSRSPIASTTRWRTAG